MTASPANGFAQFKYAPTGNSCKAIPYAFHPMYSTSSEQTRVIWAAHSYNIAFSDETGHFDSCSGRVPIPVSDSVVSCPAADFEGRPGDREAADGDDDFCFPASESSLIQVA